MMWAVKKAKINLIVIAVFWGEEKTTVIFQLVGLDRFNIKGGIKGIDFQMHCCINVSVIVVLG